VSRCWNAVWALDWLKWKFNISFWHWKICHNTTVAHPHFSSEKSIKSFNLNLNVLRFLHQLKNGLLFVHLVTNLRTELHFNDQTDTDGWLFVATGRGTTFTGWRRWWCTVALWTAATLWRTVAAHCSPARDTGLTGTTLPASLLYCFVALLPHQLIWLLFSIIFNVTFCPSINQPLLFNRQFIRRN
jgi:hypothetical protein